ncbi:MAG: hypothetical protein IKR04_03010 [Clostridia bacterium]|nr:hypothetical protein [Clostridia bacterium]
MLKKQKGSITIMAFVIMLFIALYGALILGNSTRKYRIQTNDINTIISAYKSDLTEQDLRRLYENSGGQAINY